MSTSSSGLTFKLHPLVIVNISDHYTRVKSQSAAQGNGSPRVFGCVIGVQRGRTVEIFNSFELLYDASTETLDRAFLDKKQEQSKHDMRGNRFYNSFCYVSALYILFLMSEQAFHTPKLEAKSLMPEVHLFA